MVEWLIVFVVKPDVLVHIEKKKEQTPLLKVVLCPPHVDCSSTSWLHPRVTHTHTRTYTGTLNSIDINVKYGGLNEKSPHMPHRLTCLNTCPLLGDTV